jgi:hypothetical protein
MSQEGKAILKEGFSFGVGSSIGHKLMDGIFNDKKEEKNINNKEEVIENKIFFDSNKEVINNSDILFKKYDFSFIIFIF